MKKRILFILLALTLALALALPATAQNAKVLTIAYTQEPDNLNPLYTNMWFAVNVIDLMLAKPWSIDQNGNPVPEQVTEIPSVENGGVSEDGTVITLKLRDDIVWSDGEPIKASDYVFTYQMYISDANLVQSRYPFDTAVKSVEAPDDRTVVVTFNEPFAPWVPNLQLLQPLPEHVLGPIYEQEGTLDNAAWNRAPDVVSGPFKFKEWETGSHLSVVPNENYYDGMAKLDEIFFRFVPDDASVVAALIAGDADVGPFIAFSDTPALEETGNITIEITPSGYNEAWFLNVNPETAHPAMLDINVRKALAMAFDREKIVNDLLFGKTRVAVSYWDGSPYVRPDAAPVPYDPDMAAQLLDEAGWVDSDGDGVRDKDGVKLELRFITTTRQIRKDVQAVVQQDFAQLGIALILENYPSDIFFGSYGQGGPVATGQYDIAEWSQNFEFPDPNTSTFRCSEIPSDETPEGSNWMSYCDEELDNLFAEQSRTTDPAKRTELLHQIDQKLTDAYVWIGVWYDADLWAYNNRLQNALFSGADPFWNAVNWDLSS